MKSITKALFSATFIGLLTLGFTACASKKHTNCESYGNKAGYVETPTEKVPS